MRRIVINFWLEFLKPLYSSRVVCANSMAVDFVRIYWPLMVDFARHVGPKNDVFDFGFLIRV